jgi:hypothetical protein
MPLTNPLIELPPPAIENLGVLVLDQSIGTKAKLPEARVAASRLREFVFTA